MIAATPHMCIADGDAFMAASRFLFGPITQSFLNDAVPAAPMLVSMHLGVCRLSEIRADPHTVLHDRRQRRSFDPDAIKILMQLGGRSRFEQQSTAVDLEPRSAIIYDPVRSYSLQNLSNVDQLILQVPRSNFGDGTLFRLGAPLSLFDESGSLARIVAGLMQVAISEGERLDEACRKRVGESLIQLVHGLIRSGPSAPEFRRTPLEVLRERIIAYIDANLAHNRLTPSDIARQMGCSRRYLHRAFEGESVTLERLIWERRLERSRDALLSPERSAMSISEIAFSCGFNSSAHFSRAFKSKYDVAPRELRESMRKAVH